MGTFVECIAQMEGLENLIVVECDKVIINIYYRSNV